MPLINAKKYYVEGVILLEPELPRGVRYNSLRRVTLNASGKFVSLQIDSPSHGVRNDGFSSDIEGWYLSDCALVTKGEQYSLFDGKQRIGVFTVKTIGPRLELSSSV